MANVHVGAKARSLLGFGLVGLGLMFAGLAGGCDATASASPRQGQLQLIVGSGHGPADYALAGRFGLRGLSTGSARYSELEVDADSLHASVALPAGTYSLTLDPGATLLCPSATGPAGPGAVERPVSSWPRIIVIQPDRTTLARLDYGSARASSDPALARAEHAAGFDPCGPAEPAPDASAVLVQR
jgi:hypothetical protein